MTAARHLARVDHAVVGGTFSLDGQTFAVDNNIWVVGDDTECVIIDAPHDVAAILSVVGDRTVQAILCTHAHDDHIRVAPELRERADAPIMLHPDDERTHTVRGSSPAGARRGTAHRTDAGHVEPLLPCAPDGCAAADVNSSGDWTTSRVRSAGWR
ncbi:MBL fold metallo-hydrolase [Streptomyces hygroscopicus]|uniref:MBL fold metallo-hydrolase n=1 Tax=Streptomyces hygroscopicus TaxID=1912 RepID=UPI00362E623D